MMKSSEPSDHLRPSGTLNVTFFCLLVSSVKYLILIDATPDLRMFESGVASRRVHEWSHLTIQACSPMSSTYQVRHPIF